MRNKESVGEENKVITLRNIGEKGGIRRLGRENVEERKNMYYKIDDGIGT